MPRLVNVDSRARDELGRCPAVRFAVLFGSQATGRATDSSDVDIAVWPSASEWSLGDELALQARLSMVLGREVDLVRLDTIDPYLGFRVAQEGCMLVERRPHEFLTWATDATLTWLDLESLIRETTDQLIRARLPGAPP